MTDPVELAKTSLDVGTMVNDWEAAESFWAESVGIGYEKFEKIGGGVRQHRFGVNGTVVKVNHSRNALGLHPTIHRRLRIAMADVTAPTIRLDSEGVEVEVVPQGHDDIHGIEVVNATADLQATGRFWTEGLGAEQVGAGRYLLGTSLIQLRHIRDLVRPTQRSAAGFRYLTVQVRNVDTAFDRMLELGFAGESAPRSLGDTARICFVRDPDGAYVEISQRAEFTGEPIPQG